MASPHKKKHFPLRTTRSAGTPKTPTKLSSRQKEILREFRETETGEECPESQGFFGKLRTMFAE